MSERFSLADIREAQANAKPTKHRCKVTDRRPRLTATPPDHLRIRHNRVFEWPNLNSVTNDRWR